MSEQLSFAPVVAPWARRDPALFTPSSRHVARSPPLRQRAARAVPDPV